MRPQTAKASTLFLTIDTWKKDSYGLYDYESTQEHNDKEVYEIQGPCKLFRNWLTAKTSVVSNESVKRGIIPSENHSFLASITLHHNGNFEHFMLGTPEKPTQEIIKKQASEEPGALNTNSYIVVKSFKVSKQIKGYPLKVGDIFKLGRVEFRVMEVGGKQVKNKKHQSLLQEFEGNHIVTKDVPGTCKFCLCEEVTDQNYMISPCKCSGSCEVVHVECLRMWINSKIKKEVVGVVTTYNFTKFQCELCKEPFPRKVIKGSIEREMLDIEKPAKPFMMIENVNERKESKDQRCLHFLCPEEGKPIRMGRGHQCEIKLQDISVSRMHSEIRFQQSQFFLTDQNSKFGTLVRLDHPIELHRNLKVQVGRSLYEFSCA